MSSHDRCYLGILFWFQDAHEMSMELKKICVHESTVSNLMHIVFLNASNSVDRAKHEKERVGTVEYSTVDIICFKAWSVGCTLECFISIDI